MGKGKYPQFELVTFETNVAQVSASTPCLPKSKENNMKTRTDENNVLTPLPRRCPEGICRRSFLRDAFLP